MKKNMLMRVGIGLVCGLAAVAQEKVPAVYPTAIFAFEERGAGVKDYGQKISDILFASLASNPNLLLVDRTDIKKTLEEFELNLSGAVTPGEAVKVGQLIVGPHRLRRPELLRFEREKPKE